MAGLTRSSNPEEFSSHAEKFEVLEEKIEESQPDKNILDHPRKQTILRVKRKRTQTAAESIWVETGVSPQLKLARMNLNSSTTEIENSSQKVLFTLVRTELQKLDFSETFFSKILSTEEESKRIDRLEIAQPEIISKRIHRSLEAGIKRHEIASKRARYKQIQNKRTSFKSTVESIESTNNEIFHLYDVLAMEEDEIQEKISRREKAKREAISSREGKLLCNFTPLIREYIPEVADEFITEIQNQKNQKDDYVYDVYIPTQDDETSKEHESIYPIIRITDDDEFDFNEINDSDYDSEDSNDEKNPMNDYPEDEDGDGDEDEEDDDEEREREYETEEKEIKHYSEDEIDVYYNDDEEYDSVAYDRYRDVEYDSYNFN